MNVPSIVRVTVLLALLAVLAVWATILNEPAPAQANALAPFNFAASDLLNGASCAGFPTNCGPGGTCYATRTVTERDPDTYEVISTTSCCIDCRYASSSSSSRCSYQLCRCFQVRTHPRGHCHTKIRSFAYYWVGREERMVRAQENDQAQ